MSEELTGHLGYEEHDPAGRGSGNSRNGTTPKTVLTDIGAVDLAVPRDRNGTFEPQVVRKGQTRLEGFNERVIALYARDDHPRHPRALRTREAAALPITGGSAVRPAQPVLRPPPTPTRPAIHFPGHRL